MAGDDSASHRGLQRLLWFAGLWVAGVLTVSSVALLLRALLL